MNRRSLLIWSFSVAIAGAPAKASRNASLRAELDRPYSFLFDLPGWKATDSGHESDLFSTWGYVVLRLDSRRIAEATAVRGGLRQAARVAGWKISVAPAADKQPAPAGSTFTASGEPLGFHRTVRSQSRSPATQYVLNIWFSRDHRAMLAAYRVDGE